MFLVRHGAPQASQPHITILIANLPAERDRRVIRQCLSLERAGFQVTVIAPRGERGLTRLPGSRNTVLRPYPMLIMGSGFVTFAVEFLWSFLCIAVRLTAEVLSGRAHAIQVCNPPDIYWPLALLARALGRPWVFDHHDLCPEVYATRAGAGHKRLVYRALEGLEWLTMRTASAVFSTNESFRDIALKRGVRPERVTVVRNGPAKWELDSSPRVVPTGPLSVVYLGVLGPQDNVRGAVLAAEELVRLRGRDDWRLVIAGDGEELANLKALTTERGLDDVVEFTGWLGPQGVDDLLRNATCAIQPDLPTRMNELSTMAKTVEYLGRGVPVVAVDLLETRRTAGEAGLYVPTGAPGEFAGAIHVLLNDPDLRSSMSAQGRRRFISSLAWEHQAAGYLSVWRALLAKRLRRPAADMDATLPTQREPLADTRDPALR